MNSRTFVVLALIALTQSKIGDRIPFCYFPERFDTTVQPTSMAVDVNRYQGTWYEVARSLNLSEINCLCSQAEYTYNHLHLYMKMRHTCLRKDGGNNVQEVVAVSKNCHNSFWKLYYLPLVGGNYFILDMDPEYKWVVVGNPCRTNFWIMSRDKEMDADCLEQRLVNLRRLGFCTKNVVLRSETCKEKSTEEN